MRYLKAYREVDGKIIGIYSLLIGKYNRDIIHNFDIG